MKATWFTKFMIYKIEDKGTTHNFSTSLENNKLFCNSPLSCFWVDIDIAYTYFYKSLTLKESQQVEVPKVQFYSRSLIINWQNCYSTWGTWHFCWVGGERGRSTRVASLKLQQESTGEIFGGRSRIYHNSSLPTVLTVVSPYLPEVPVFSLGSEWSKMFVLSSRHSEEWGMGIKG
jgi:hypothetical protein